MTVSYDLVYRTLKKKIIDGEYPPKSFLPAEPVLCKQFNVSRTTVRHAVDLLTQEGYIRPQRGIGTVVLKTHAVQDLNRLSSITATLTQKGYDVTMKAFSIVRELADKEIAESLDIPLRSDVAHVSRVIVASGTPVAVVENYIPYPLVEGIEQETGKFLSLYRFLEEQYHLSIASTRDKITACNATKEEANLLEITIGFALILVRRICLDQENRPICFDVVKAVSDLYEFQTSYFNK